MQLLGYGVFRKTKMTLKLVVTSLIAYLYKNNDRTDPDPNVFMYIM